MTSSYKQALDNKFYIQALDNKLLQQGSRGKTLSVGLLVIKFKVLLTCF